MFHGRIAAWSGLMAPPGTPDVVVAPSRSKAWTAASTARIFPIVSSALVLASTSQRAFHYHHGPAKISRDCLAPVVIRRIRSVR
jgi:hypothetical protein